MRLQIVGGLSFRPNEWVNLQSSQPNPWPNRITIGRIALVAPFVYCLLHLGRPDANEQRWAAIILFALMAASDGLDGYLARRLHAISDLGRFLDPFADKLLITAAVVILWSKGIADDQHVGSVITLPTWVAVAALGKDVLVTVGFLTLMRLSGRVHVFPRPLGKWCTAIQLLMVLGLLLRSDLPAGLRNLPQWLWTLSAILAISSVLDYIYAGRQLLAAGTPTTRGDDAHAA